MGQILTAAQAELLLTKMAAFTGPTITGATNASPSVVTFSAFSPAPQVGDVHLVSGVTGNTNLNGLKTVATTPSGTTLTYNDFVTGAEVDGNGVTGGTIVCKRVVSTLVPGDLEDLLSTLAERPCTGGPFSVANRAGESSVKSLIGQ